MVNGAQSSRFPVSSGVPEGTVLGPLLFLIYINDNFLGIDSEIRLFADDCILYREICNSCDSASLQCDINKLCAWSYKWQMSFTVSKCCILSIYRKRTPPPALNYTLGNTLLSVVNSHSYLGVTVSSDLRWHEHVNNVSAQATKTLSFIRHNVYCCPPYIKATAYISVVRPHLEYAAAAWDLYLVGDCKQLEKVQRRAARFLKRDCRSTASVSSLISQLGWQSLSDRRRNSRLSLMYKSLHGLAGISTSPFRCSSKPTRSADGDTFCVLSSRTDPYKYSFYPHTIVDWNALPASVKSRPSIYSFRCAIPSSLTISI